jgi:Secretion system C-terminal sorting domain
MKTIFKKILLLALFVAGSIFTAQAQYVTIPDANFRAFLQGQYPACFNAQGKMDTTCMAVRTATNMVCNYQNIANLEGIQYFDGLQSLMCDYNQLTTLPALPVTLRGLYCSNNQLTTLPALPTTLEDLNCGDNQLTILPVLPPALKDLLCHNNQLTSLPVLPPGLKTLACHYNQLTTLPTLSATLHDLLCSYNQLTSLPALPPSLQNFLCSYNQLTSLPALPPALETLGCADNPLACLSFLPNVLVRLDCPYSITCLPNIPASLQFFYIQNNLQTSTTLPLCTPNNLNGCLFSGSIFGKAYQDLNSNCAADGSDILQQNITIQAKNTLTQEVYVSNSNAGGLYEIGLPAPATYEIKAIFQNNYWTACAPQIVTLTQNTNQIQQDVLVKPIVQCADMEIDHQLQNIARPCSTAVYKVAYFNSGTIPSAGAFAKITLPADLTLQNMTRPYTAMGGGVFEVQLPSVAALAQDTFSLSANVSCAAAMNQMLCTEVEILPHTFCNAGLSGWDGSDIELTGRCVGQDSIRFIITNTGNGGMATGRTYGVVEDNVMIRSSTFQLPVGGKDSITVAADPLKIYRMIADEAPNNPSGNTQETFLVWGCHGINPQIHWGFVNQFGLNNGSQNPHSLCTPVRTSFDPNDIAATPEGTTAQHFILKNTDLEYKIRFQNTGNDTAFVVRVIDKIAAELDLTTLRVGSASHPMTYSLKANGTLEFLFQNIRLEDSTSNEPKSHGFVTYKIKTKPNIVIGSIINNQAFIYFDANAPVATNIYTHTIGENLSTIFISTIEVIDNQEFSVKIMPNPMHDAAVFEIGDSRDSQSPRDALLTLYNTLGQAVKTQQFIDGKLILERDNLPQGCYFYKITNEGKMMAQGKVVIAP